jgi:hypothetical protein
VRGKRIVWLSLLAILLTSPIVVNISFAQDPPTIFVNPPTTQTNPTELFQVSIDIRDAVHVAGFEFKVTWDLALTEFPPEVGEGYFLQDFGPVHQEVKDNILFKYVLVTAFMEVYGWSEYTEGTLATITWKVLGDQSGSSPIDLYDTKLLDENGNLIPHNVEDGSFYTTKPKPVISWTPEAPIAGEMVTFDGTASYDPEGTPITAYEWDFGDGSPHEFGAVVTHTYANYQLAPYVVTLKVTDSGIANPEWWAVPKPLQIWRDLGIVSVWPSMTEADTTDYDAYATTLDYYEDPGAGLLSVIVTVVNFGTLEESYSLSVIVEGTDYRGVTHSWEIAPTAIWFMGTEYPTTIGAGAGSGFGNWMLFDISYGAQTSLGLLGEQINTPVPPGQYTITATLTSEFDQDPTNNVMSVPFGVHGSVEGIAFGGFQWGWHHGPVSFYGIMMNLDNTIGVFRDPIDEQGEYARIQYEIVDRATGLTVETVYSQTKYLNYRQWALVSATATLSPGKYICNWMVQFGTDDSSFPYWGQYMRSFKFTVRP